MTQVNFYSKEQIDEREIGEPTDSASSTGSLWARIKNAVARIVSLETADSNNVKKTGTSTVTGTLEVPTAPPTPTSAINSVYVNDATEGVNNLVHKSGNETINGIKTHTSLICIDSAYPTVMTGGASLAQYANVFVVTKDITDLDTSKRIMRMQSRTFSTSTAFVIGCQAPNVAEWSDIQIIVADNGSKYVTVSDRISNLAQVSGNTTYDNDVVTIGVLKKLGLIS
ncbi:MAG: hypothetical protein IKE74_10850 [Mogibacterium sp.]|nr:hypothetical protein [Mogibacterium sp.]